jgi:hypothetical protein
VVKIITGAMAYSSSRIALLMNVEEYENSSNRFGEKK